MYHVRLIPRAIVVMLLIATTVVCTSPASGALPPPEPGTIIGWGSNIVAADVHAEVEAVSAGTNFSIALMSDGSLRAFGSNTGARCEVPAPNSDFIAVSAGDRHTLALKSDGRIIAWGDNRAGKCNVPTPNSDFIAVAAGYDHSIGLKTDGSVVAWGASAYGLLDIPSPNTGFTAIAAGTVHNLALKSDGSVVAWGQNSYGQCDIPAPNSGFVAIAAGSGFSAGLKADGSIAVWGTISAAPSPNEAFTSIAGGGCVMAVRSDGSVWASHPSYLPSPNTGFTAVAAGTFHRLGIKTDGSVFGWGDNYYGQCNAPHPNRAYTAISCGDWHRLAVRSDGSIVAWGDNTYGQCNEPSPNSDFVSVAAGWRHSMGLKSDGSVVVWGTNVSGQYNVPPPNAGFTAIAAANHNLALRSDGSIAAWGDNASGQCNVPAPNNGFTAVAASYFHSLGLKSDGSIVAWGSNTYGQCNVPAPNSGFVAIGAGYYHSLGIKSDGSVVAWGRNDSGQCMVPGPNSGFVAVDGGLSHSIGLKQGGSAVGWGSDQSSYGLPQPNIGFVAISAGYGENMALTPYASAQTPTFTPPEGRYDVPQNVTITCATEGATIRYTINGADPTEADPIIPSGGQVTVSVYPPTILKARAWAPGFSPSDVQAALYRRPVIFVKPSGDDADTGFTWDQAKRTVQAGIDTALAGDDVWVVAGLYKPTSGADRNVSFALKDGVSVYGGFVGAEMNRSQRDWVSNVTILTGDLLGNDSGPVIYNEPSRQDNSYTVVRGSADSVIDGFTIRDGNADGGGAGMQDAGGRVSNCIFDSNAAYNWGGGLLTRRGQVVDCTFIRNRAGDGWMSFGGGGICVEDGDPTVIGCKFIRNSSKYYGGGALNDGTSKARYINCIFAGNLAPDGGGMASCANVDPTVDGCVFVGNSSHGMTNHMGRWITVRNSTFMLNAGAAICNDIGSSVVTNCILWGNPETGGTQITNGMFSSATVSYTNILNGWTGEGNLYADPQFVRTPSKGLDGVWGTEDDDYGDLSLQGGSPCIDAGNNAAVPSYVTTDIAGAPRIQGTVDMGAYESGGSIEQVSISEAKAAEDGTMVGIGGAIVSAAWGDVFYVEADDRSSGIRVERTAHGLAADTRADVTGTVQTSSDGERYIAAITASTAGSGSVPPVAVLNKDTGGSGVAGGAGLDNIGLLIRTRGAVTQIGSGYLYIDDGSNLHDGTLTGSEENIGVRVICNPAGYSAGDKLEVTGISSCFKAASDQIARRILTRGPSDVREIAH